MADWQLKYVKELGEIITGRTPSTKRKEFYAGDYNLISPADLDNGKYIRTAHKRLTKLGFEQCRAVPRDTVLVGCIGNVGKLGMVADECSATNQQINALICNAENDPDFVYYCFHANKERLERAAVKTTVPILNKTNFGNLELALPPLLEQKKIAHILLTVQRAIEAQERIIQTSTELKKALMQKTFTKGLRNESQKQTVIGPVPESWEVVPLESIAKVGNGSTPKRSNDAYWKSGTIPWLNSTKIHERFITEADQFITPQAVKECHLPHVAPNSLLIAITGQGKTLGNSALTRFETCINQHLAYAQFHSDKIVPDFVLWFMQTRYDFLRSIAQAGGSTKGALTCGYLKTHPIPIPTKDEQEEIVNVFSQLYRKQRVARRKQACLQYLLRVLLHELMTAKIRVHKLELP